MRSLLLSRILPLSKQPPHTMNEMEPDYKRSGAAAPKSRSTVQEILMAQLEGKTAQQAQPSICFCCKFFNSTGVG